MSFHKVCDISHDVLLWHVSDIALDSCWALHVVLLAVKDGLAIVWVNSEGSSLGHSQTVPLKR